jgi:hypothetical protein
MSMALSGLASRSDDEDREVVLIGDKGMCNEL